MIKKKSNLYSNSTTPSNKLNKNYDSLYLQTRTRTPLNSKSIHNVLVIHKKPKITNKKIKPLPTIQFPQPPSKLFSIILYHYPSPSPKFYPNFNPYSKPKSNTKS